MVHASHTSSSATPQPGSSSTLELVCCRVLQVDSDPYVEPECPCGMSFCFKCLRHPHSPCTCQMWNMWDEKINGDSETRNWLAANTKPCPKCSKPVEKNGGCNLVVCKCGQVCMSGAAAAVVLWQQRSSANQNGLSCYLRPVFADTAASMQQCLDQPWPMNQLPCVRLLYQCFLHLLCLNHARSPSAGYVGQLLVCATPGHR